MEAQKPAKGISQEREFNDASVYRVECECSCPDHSVAMWIEIDSDKETQDIQVAFFADTWTPWWDRYYNRFKCIWKLLTTGIVRYEHHMILNKQAAINFATVILNDVKKLEEIKNERDASRKT
ncbi:MAG TPA: hypothetical protein VFM18_18680 [Methanosarcina sp.]|nr:hypothetical protein [Methanosarcina sp.]